MNKPLIVVHNINLLPFHLVQKRLGPCFPDLISGVLVNDQLIFSIRNFRCRLEKKSYEWQAWEKKTRIIRRSEITDGAPLDSFADEQEIQSIIREAVCDPRTFLIADRSQNGGLSAYQATFALSAYIPNCIRILKDVSPCSVIFQTAPHDLVNWVFAKASEALGIPVSIIERSVVPGCFKVVRGVNKRKEIYPLRNNSDGSRQLSSLIEINQGSYEDAEPEATKRRRGKGIHEKWKWVNELATCTPKNPLRWRSAISASLEKRRAFVEHQKNVTVDPDLNGCYVSFFLHYQPERTTVPDGGRYGQQLFAIQEIASVLQPNERLLVKEHPSIFRRPFHPYVRPEGFYSTITRTPKVTLCPLLHDSFQLIDKSMLVSTISGTVGFQAVCRGKPALAFGRAPYHGAPGVFSVGTTDIATALANCRRGIDISKAEIEDYLKQEYSNSAPLSESTRALAFGDKFRQVNGLIDAVFWAVHASEVSPERMPTS